MSLKTDVSWPLWRLALRAAGVGLFGLGLALASIATAGAQAGEPRFTLNASGASVTCDAPSEPSECKVGAGAAFTLSIDLLDPPAAGYIAIQTQIYLDGLNWTPATASAENVWPDNNLPVRFPDPPEPGVVVVGHGGLTATSVPFPLSHHEGPVVELQVSCPQDPQTFDPTLIAHHPVAAPNGSAVSLEDETIVSSPVIGTAELDLVAGGEPQTVPVTNILTIRCGGQSAPPGDDIPGLDFGGTIDGDTQPGDTPDATEGPSGRTTPGEDGTAGPGGEETPATAGPDGEDDDGGGAPWAIIGVVIGAVAVAGAGGAYLWYLRRSRTAT